VETDCEIAVEGVEL